MSEEKIMGFEEILGNEMVKDHFKKAIQNHKISHAYILTGEAGMGRKSIANAFAMTLLCEKGGSEPRHPPYALSYFLYDCICYSFPNNE